MCTGTWILLCRTWLTVWNHSQICPERYIEEIIVKANSILAKQFFKWNNSQEFQGNWPSQNLPHLISRPRAGKGVCSTLWMVLFMNAALYKCKILFAVYNGEMCMCTHVCTFHAWVYLCMCTCDAYVCVSGHVCVYLQWVLRIHRSRSPLILEWCWVIPSLTGCLSFLPSLSIKFPRALFSVSMKPVDESAPKCGKNGLLNIPSGFHKLISWHSG